MFRYFLFALLLLFFFIWMKNLLINDISIAYNIIVFPSNQFSSMERQRVLSLEIVRDQTSELQWISETFLPRLHRARHETFWNSMHATFSFFNKLENSLGTDTIRLMYKEKSKIRFRKKKNLVKKKICVKCS